jgi:TRAP-type mannitol/chloroaromatic compound transport system permease small subunit
MQKYIAFADWFSDWSGRYISYLILPMIGVIVYTALLRYILDIAVDWGFEVAVFVYGVHCFLGGGYAMLLKAHITVDTLPRRLPLRVQKYIQMFSFLIVITVCLVAVWQGSKWAWKSTLIWERSIHQTVFNPPIWWFKWVIPVSAALIVIQALADMFKTIQSLSDLKKES